MRLPIALAALALAGCLTEPSNGTTAGEGVYGVALLGPMCPVERDPPDPACADRPYQGNFTVTTAAGSRGVKAFASDAQGRFNVTLAPGEYAIRGADEGTLPYCASEGTFTVTQGRWTLANVSCDSGIR